MRIDLNLLVVFNAVARCGSVTLAAQQLSLSQPAVSHALNRLRHQLGDPLFQRGKGGFTLTNRALELQEPVRRLLSEAEDLFVATAFLPSQSDRTFTIAATDYAASTILPKLLEGLRRDAPHISLRVETVGEKTLDALKDGHLHLSFWGAKPPDSPWCWRALHQDNYVGVIDAAHPLSARAKKNRVSLEDYVRYPHAVVSLKDPGSSLVDAALAGLGQKRNKILVTPSFVTNLSSMRRTDLIATVPTKLLDTPLLDGYISFTLPFALQSFDYGLVWHERSAHDAGLKWLRTQIFRQAAVQMG
jgi:DNA-binding transcriptional LysR family regulator